MTYGGASQTSIDAAGIVGAGNKMTAVGGFVFNPYGAPGAGLAVRLFNSAFVATATSCASASNVVAQDVVESTGFYFIWRTGLLNDSQGQTNLLPSGVQYAVQVCNGADAGGPDQDDRRQAPQPGVRAGRFRRCDVLIVSPGAIARAVRATG